MLLWKEVVDSAGFFADDTWLEKHTHNGNVQGDSDDVSSESSSLIFIVDGANVVNSFVMRSTIF